MKLTLSLALVLLTSTAFAAPDKFAYVGSSNSSGTAATPITAPATSSSDASASDGGPLSDLADLFKSDFAEAAKLATATSVQDGNGQACWTAFGPFGELVTAHPHVFTGKLATDLEAQRLLVMNARKLCDNTACQTVFSEAANAVSKLASNLPISVNLNVTPINLFAKACNNVPNIAVVAPSAVATPAASPSPTPSAQ